MKPSRILVLVLAVGAAGGAFLLATAPKPAPVEQAAQPAAPPPTTDDVLVASKEFGLGTLVDDSDLSWQAWPKTALAAGMIIRSQEPKALDDLRGSIARANFYGGEPVRKEKLIKGANSGFMSAILPSGMRAVAISIDSSGAATAGGFILPNDRVDVVRTYHDESSHGMGTGNPNAFTSETILRNVRVLAIGQNVQDKNGQPVVTGSTATLELDPVQAETVILAQRIGQLSLTLRSMQDAAAQADAGHVKEDGSVTVVRFGQASEGLGR